MSCSSHPTDFIRRELPITVALDRATFLANAKGSDRLIVTLMPTVPRMQGSLNEVIFDAIEWSLREQGAAPLDAAIEAGFETRLAEQLYRVKLLGASGIALELEDLSAIADFDNTLCPSDSRTLLNWIHATQIEAVQLLLPPNVRALRIYPEPVRLETLLPRSKNQGGAVIEYEPFAVGASTESNSRVSGDDAAAPPSLFPPEFAALSVDSFFDELAASTAQSEARATTDAPAPAGEHSSLSTAAAAEFAPAPVVARSNNTESKTQRRPKVDALPALAATQAHAEAPLRELVHESPADEDLRSKVDGWIRELEATRGPKPLSVVERLFVSAYTPLMRAIRLGKASERARQTASEWSLSFEKSYRDAFEALKGRGRRPTMIMDLPEIGQRLARLHGARNVQLLLVDGMRFDLGVRINDKLQTSLTRRAACAERVLMWSGLPATTATQLELLGRGTNALQEFTGELDEDLIVNRGRTANLIRRIRTGHREVMKLDLVEARLTATGDTEEERLANIADEVGTILTSHIESVPSNTLVIVFGDHGFSFDNDEQGRTKGLKAPSARPEEILVPAFAWLAGSVH